MSETKQSLDLSALENDYEIVGEVSGSRDSRTFMATRKDAGTKRRGDDTGVLISVATSPAGDEGNALSHLAADTQMLAGSPHRRLIPVIEGRWIGDDAFAVVTQRTTDPSLAQKLATGETFSTTRVAAILREVNGLLEWARDHNVVHRNITAERIFLEPKTDRVRVSFGVTPIRRIQQADAPTEDARTIVRLAMAMLTGIEDPGSYNGQALAELRPDLPERLREATAELLEDKKAHTPADVSAYLALIGMADQLSAGETEAGRIRAEVLEEQRVERLKLAAERAELERVIVEERVTFGRFMADEHGKFERQKADERESVERLKADEREKAVKDLAEFERAMMAERAALGAERAALAAKRAELVAKRAEFERAMAEQREAIERVAGEDRRRVDALRAEIKAVGELEIEKKRQAALEDITDAESALDQAEFATPLFIPAVNVPLEELTFDDDTAVMRDDEIVVEPAHDVETPLETSGEGATVATGVKPTRKKWIVPTALAGLVAIVGATAIAFGARHTMTPPAAKPVVRPVIAQAPVAAPPTSIVPLPPPAAIVDSSGGSAVRSFDSTKAVVAVVKRKPKKIVRDSVGRGDSTSSADSLPLFRDASPKKRDTLVKKDSLARPDTMPR